MGVKKLTVIIPTVNKKELLAECLKSLKNQTYLDFDIIVIDNGSTDGTSKFVEENYPKIRIIKNQTNKGFVAVNQGIKSSSTEFVVLLNNDAIAKEDWLEELVAGLKRHPEAGFAASKMLKADQKTIDSAGDGFNLNIMGGYAIGSGKLDSEKYNEEKFCFSASGGAAIYRKEVFEKVGKFDEKFFAYFEDIDFGFRANFAGFKCVYIPKAVVYHRGGETAVHNSLYHLRLTDRNKIITVLKNLPFRYFLKYKRATFDLLFWPLIELLKQGPRVLPFFWNRLIIFVWLPDIFSDRFRIRKTRVISDEELEKLLV